MFSIVWHGNYARYFEVARCQLLDEIQYNYLDMADSGYVFPVVDFNIRFIQSIVFNQHIQVNVMLREWQNWLKFSYLITDLDSGERLTRGTTRQVAVEAQNGKMLDETPAVLLQKIDAAFALRATQTAAGGTQVQR